MSNEKKPNEINIELDESMAEGTYSNLVMITHSNSEFVMDFIRVMPQVPKAKVKSRIILNPPHAKRLLHALRDNVAKFESSFGTIKEQEGPSIPLNFGGPMGQA